ncbi:MAG: alpha/beta fold hydrolase, partial [Acidimicrobiales bacterium]
ARRLADLLADVGLARVVLGGHSDGGSIALLQPTQAGPGRVAVAAVVSMSAHVMVEDVTVAAIRALRFPAGGRVRRGLARHHDHAGALIDAWTEVWLSERFRSWTIDAELSAVRCPTLIIQGRDDRYGTIEQVERLRVGLSSSTVETVLLEGVDHWPHREAADAVITALEGFLGRHCPS